MSKYQQPIPSYTLWESAFNFDQQYKISGNAPRRKRALVNLARYEGTRPWGCKHPTGSRWKKAEA